MASQAVKTRQGGKRPQPDEPVAESSKKAQKRACTTDSQSRLPFARPPPSPPATQATPTTASTPCPVDESDEEEPLIKGTIRADERTCFEPNWTLVVDASSYRERARTQRSTGASRISFIYKHGLQLERKQPNGQFGKIYWLCKHCHDLNKRLVPLAASATSQSIVHLCMKHSIVWNGRLAEPPQSIVPHLSPTPYSDRHKPAAERFIDNFIHWVVEEDITFSQASSDRLRALIASGGPQMATLIPSANTVRAWIIKACNDQREEVKKNLKEAQSKISLSWDMWTTTNDQSLLGVCAHWIDAAGIKQEALIALPPVRSHHGSDIAVVLRTVIEPYGIGNNLGAFQGDNATNNDTTVNELCQWYHIDTDEQRMRCLGHVLNLVVQALLYGDNLSAFKKELDGASDLSQFKSWRKKGAIGKLHNLVVYICRSEQRTGVFSDIQRGLAEDLETNTLRLKRDTGVRWNSTYTMINRALDLKGAHEAYCHRWQRPKGKDAYDLTADFLDEQDWEELRHFHELLMPFYALTVISQGKAAGGHGGALWEVLPVFHRLFEHLKERQDEVAERRDLFTDHYKHSVNAGFMKMRQYYGLTDNTRLYRMAIALHPLCRTEWFDQNWSQATTSRNVTSTASPATTTALTTYSTTDHTAKPAATFTARFYELMGIKRVEPDEGEKEAAKERERMRTKGELDRYLQAELDLEGYETGLAFTVFSIPAMSSECERAFSRAGKVITDERYQLKADIIEADQLMKSWLIADLVNRDTAWRVLSEIEQQALLERHQQPLQSQVPADTAEGGI